MPGLSLPEVADNVIEGIQSGYEFIVTNFANGDVIGHTANTDGKVECARIVDTHLGRVVEAAKKQGYVIAITADHGNLEVMLTADGKPHVAHTTNFVNFLLIDPQSEAPHSLKDGSLCDVAPTVLQILDIPQPEQMAGKSLADGAHDFGKNRRVLLIILDGWGIGKSDGTNPIHIADTPVWDGLIAAYPPSKLRASGDAVGLQEGKAGNSEAGHLNLGCGRVVQQDDVRLDSAMKDGSFEKNEVFLRTIEDVKQRGKTLHLLALLTKKSSHGSIDYPLALLRMAKQQGFVDVCVHIIFDGRSTEPGSAPRCLKSLMIKCRKSAQAVLWTARGGVSCSTATAISRRSKKAYDALVYGKGRLYQ